MIKEDIPGFVGGCSVGITLAAVIFGAAGLRMYAAFDLAVGGILALLFIGLSIQHK